MKQITGLKALPLQTFSMVDIDNSLPIKFTLTFRPRVQAWFMDLTYQEFSLSGFKLHLGPNILRQFQHRIPFGLALLSSDNGEPFLINDLSSGRISLYLLSTSEVEDIETAITTGAWE